MTPEEFDVASPIAENLRVIPQYAELAGDPDNLRRLFVQSVGTYLELITDFTNLAEDQVIKIEEALTQYRGKGGSLNSASGNSLPKLWRLIGDRRQDFLWHLKSTLNPTSIPAYSNFSNQVALTSEMMARAYKMNKEAGPDGYNFHDGDPKSDSVRWTYLQIVPGELGQATYLHYFVSHLLDQVAMSWIKENYDSEELEKEGIDLKKDGALAIISDLLSFHYGNQNEGESHKDIRKYWQTPRPDGGLGWIKDARLNSFREYFQEV